MDSNKDDQIIEDVIKSFRDYALNDIKFNKDRPIAAGILCACLLDQVSALFYRKGKAVDKARQFIKKYLPQYTGIDLFDILRNPLVHNYSIKRNYSLTSDPHLSVYGLSILPDGIIFIPSFIKDLEVAIEKAFEDLRKDKEIRSRALQRVKEHEILVQSKVELAIYSKEEISRLQTEYLPLIKSHKIFANDDTLELNIIFSPLPNSNFEAFIEVKELEGEKETTKYPLHFFAQHLGLVSPIEFLESQTTFSSSFYNGTHPGKLE